jgi:hypothetical protein
MTEEPTTIEVEVLEIDGQPAPPSAADPAQNPRSGRWPQGTGAWRGWSTTVSRLDRRWWPLWVLLGLVGVVLLVIVGLVAACVWLVFAFARALLRALGLLSQTGGPRSTSLR